jgi:hypothetical protein
MRIYLHLLFITLLGTTNFYFTTSMLRMDNLVKYSESWDYSRSFTINFSKKIVEYSKLNTPYFNQTSTVEAEIQEKILKTKTTSKNERKENKLQQEEVTIYPLELFKKINSLKIFLTLCFILVLLIISFLVVKLSKFIKKNSLVKIKLDMREKEVERLEEELSKINKDLTDFALDIARKNEFTQEIEAQLKQLKKVTSVATKENLLQELIFKTHNHLKTNESFEKFQQNIKKVNHDFFEKMSVQFDNITCNEIHLCGLIRLGLTIKDIAAIKNISPKSVEMNRYRLRKKLELIEGQDLYQFLIKI